MVQTLEAMELSSYRNLQLWLPTLLRVKAADKISDTSIETARALQEEAMRRGHLAVVRFDPGSVPQATTYGEAAASMMPQIEAYQNAQHVPLSELFEEGHFLGACVLSIAAGRLAVTESVGLALWEPSTYRINKP